MYTMAPTIRTGVLVLGFLLGTLEVTFWVIFYTFRVEFRHSAGYSVNMDFEEDLTALSVIVGIDLVSNKGVRSKKLDRFCKPNYLVLVTKRFSFLERSQLHLKVVNMLLIAGANKDYSGRRKDLK